MTTIGPAHLGQSQRSLWCLTCFAVFAVPSRATESKEARTWHAAQADFPLLIAVSLHQIASVWPIISGQFFESHP